MKIKNILGVCAGGAALLFPFKNNTKYNILGNIEPRGVFHTSREEQWKANFKGIPFLKGTNYQKIGIQISYYLALIVVVAQ